MRPASNGIDRSFEVSKILEPADWSFPIPIMYGPGRLGELAVIRVQKQVRMITKLNLIF